MTGEKDDIYKLAMSYFANAKEDSIAPGGFLHSEYFILIDKEVKLDPKKINLIILLVLMMEQMKFI